MSQKEEHALGSYLEKLMMHIIKWKTQIGKRSKSWINTINNARKKIKELQEDKPSLTDSWIESIWEKAFKAAKKEAEGEMKQKTDIENLTWQEVFEDRYLIPAGKWAAWLLLMTLILYVFFVS
jgi:Domain of unknown function DUF29